MSDNYSSCTVKTDWLFYLASGYPGCMVYFVTIGQLYKTTSFLVVSASFHSEMRKEEETIRKLLLWFFFNCNYQTKHVTTQWLKQPICFYSVFMWSAMFWKCPWHSSCTAVDHQLHPGIGSAVLVVRSGQNISFRMLQIAKSRWGWVWNKTS